MANDVVNVLTGQKHRELSKTWTYRRMCNKPQDPKVDTAPPTVPEHRMLSFYIYPFKSIIFPFLCLLSFLVLFICTCFCCTAPRASFKVPGYRPSETDKKILLWAGRYKTADQIPEFVS